MIEELRRILREYNSKDNRELEREIKRVLTKIQGLKCIDYDKHHDIIILSSYVLYIIQLGLFDMYKSDVYNVLSRIEDLLIDAMIDSI